MLTTYPRVPCAVQQFFSQNLISRSPGGKRGVLTTYPTKLSPNFFPPCKPIAINGVVIYCQNQQYIVENVSAHRSDSTREKTHKARALTGTITERKQYMHY